MLRIYSLILVSFLSGIVFNCIGQHCSPHYSVGCGFGGGALTGDVINNFSTTGGVSNISNLNSGCNDSFGYHFFNTMLVSQFQGQSINFDIQSGPAYAQGFRIWIDWNNDFDFSDSSESVWASSSTSTVLQNGSILVPTWASVGYKRMRVLSLFAIIPGISTSCDTSLTYGECEDYIFEVLSITPCSGQPTAGNAIVSNSIPCTGDSIILDIPNANYAIDMQYQWISSISGTVGSWYLINGANSRLLKTITHIKRYYRCIVTCPNSLLFDTSGTVQVDPIPFNPYSACYCIPQNAGVACINFVNIGNLTRISNGCQSSNNYSLYDSIIPTLTKGQNYNLEVSTSNASKISVWIDWNHNAKFENFEWKLVTSNSTNNTISLPIPTNALTGQTRMRIRSRLPGNENNAGDACLNMGSGETEDYIINVTDCSDQEVHLITPKVGGNIGDVTINIYGCGFDTNTIVKLIRGTDTLIAPDSLITNYSTYRIAPTFDLRNVDTGYYDVVVEIPGDTTMTLVNGFKVVEGINNPIEFHIIGSPNIRVGSVFSFDVNIINSSNVNKYIPITIVKSHSNNPIGLKAQELNEGYASICLLDGAIIPNMTLPLGATQSVKIFSTFLSNTPNSYSIYQLTESLSDSIYNTFIDSNIVTSQSLIAQQSAIQIQSQQSIGPCNPDGCSIPPALQIFMTNPFNIFNTACNNHDKCYRTNGLPKNFCDMRFMHDMSETCDANFPVGSSAWNACQINAGANYAGVSASITINSVTYCPSCSKYDEGQQGNTCNGPEPLLPIVPEGCPSDVFVVGSTNFNKPCYSPTPVIAVDPNDKYGPYLYDSTNSNYYSGALAMHYSVHFENDSSASASAQVVIILDTLYTNVFDLSSFQLGSISIGDTSFQIPPGLSKFHEQIDLSNIGTNYVVDINAQLNDSTGVVSWVFTTLDPNTLQPATGALDGFLPPNINTNEGQASVSYSIKVYDTISNGTVVNNDAAIYFDTNPPIITNNWHNTIDNVLPQSSVNPLPFYSDSIFNISWNGVDTQSGVLSYNIYYAVNGGAYKPLLLNTQTTSYSFTGQLDSTYSFYSVATDKAGNKELVPASYDARTTIRDCNIVLQPTLDTIGLTQICLGDSVILKALGGNSYLWSNSLTADSIVVQSSGSYFVTVSDTFLCSRTLDTTVINVLSLPVVNINSSSNAICFGDTATLNGTGGVSYNWLPTLDTTSNVFVNPTIPTQYILTGFDTNGCHSKDTFDLIVNPLPTISITSITDSICIGQATTLNANGGISYLWQATGDTTNIISVSPSSSSQYVLIGSDINNCSAKDTINIVVNLLPNIIITTSSDTICANTSVLLNANGGLSYLWQPTGDTTTILNQTLNNTTNFVLTGTDVNGCSNVDSTIIYVNSLPLVAISNATNSICVGDSITLTASGAQTYSWSPIADTTAIVVVYPAITTTYYVNGTDSNNCVQIDSSIITVNALPNIQIQASADSICLGEAVTLNALNGITYLWQPIGDTTTAVTYSPNSNTQYILIGSDINNCENTDTIDITVFPLPPIPIITQIGNTLNSSYSNNNQWYSTSGIIIGANQNTYNPSGGGDFSVTYTDTFGCSSSSAIFNFIPVGITNYIDNISVSVYPNPTNGIITLECSGIEREDIVIEILNMQGQIIQHILIPNNANVIKTGIDLTRLANGVYAMTIESDGWKRYVKVVKN